MKEIVIGVVGGIIALCETFQVFILADLRDRIVRLENKFIDLAWNGEERRKRSTPQGEVKTGDY